MRTTQYCANLSWSSGRVLIEHRQGCEATRLSFYEATQIYCVKSPTAEEAAIGEVNASALVELYDPEITNSWCKAPIGRWRNGAFREKLQQIDCRASWAVRKGASDTRRNRSAE